MGVWITGDTHSYFDRFEAYENDSDITKDDIMIICGDFGGIWHGLHDYGIGYEDWTNQCVIRYEEEERKLNWLDSMPFTTAFIDGNHENFDRLFSEYPIKEWHGGKVHEIRPSIVHLIRGEVYEIDGKKFWCFGGAASHDIEDGIINPLTDPNWVATADEWWMRGLLYRINHISWWKEELPTKEEMENGRKNLEKHGWKVDYLITHSPSISEMILLGYREEWNVLHRYIDEIKEKTDYKRHYFGHMHVNKQINEKDMCLYGWIERIT